LKASAARAAKAMAAKKTARASKAKTTQENVPAREKVAAAASGPGPDVLSHAVAWSAPSKRDPPVILRVHAALKRLRLCT
jgi:hypothetical protein